MESKTFTTDIPIIFCEACNKAPMIARTISRHLLETDVTDIDFECPKCGARMRKRMPAGSQA